jgi:hypothetical protein
MIPVNHPFEQLPKQLSKAFTALKIGQHLRKSGIIKGFGVPCLELFRIVFLLVFQHKNLFRLLEGEQNEALPSKDVIYRFLNHSRYAWRKFLLSLSHSVVREMTPLTSDQRVRVFIVDDSVYSRNRSKTLELLARVHDHTTGKFIKGFSMLTLGWSDGFSFVPLDFNLLSSRNPANRLHEMKEVDRRTVGYKRRQEALLSKPEAVSKLIDHALNSDIQADYVLMDTWFTQAPLIESIVAKGLAVIGMVKQMKQRYLHESKLHTLAELYANTSRLQKNKDIQGSVNVQLAGGLAIKIVFVRNRNKKRDWLAILSTDCTLCDEEIVRIYGMRWQIETFFKVTKSYLQLGKEFQGRSYDMLVSHTTIVFARYLLLSWQTRQHNDAKTIGGMFYLFCDEVKDMDLKTALQQLWQFIQLFLQKEQSPDSDPVLCQLGQWIATLPNYIKACLPNLSCES